MTDKYRLWEFNTAKFRVVLDIEPDLHAEDFHAAAVSLDGYFIASCLILTKAGEEWIEVGYDSLGACDYFKPADFVTGHRDPDPMQRNCSLMRKAKGEKMVIAYCFPDMVRNAVRIARATLADMPKVKPPRVIPQKSIAEQYAAFPPA